MFLLVSCLSKVCVVTNFEDWVGLCCINNALSAKIHSKYGFYCVDLFLKNCLETTEGHSTFRATSLSPRSFCYIFMFADGLDV